MNSPVYVNNTSGSTSACYSGTLFSAPIPTSATTFTNANGYLNYQMTNPPASEKSVYLYRFLSFSSSTSNSGVVSTIFYRTATLSTSLSSTITPVNRNLGSSTASIMATTLKYAGPVSTSYVSSGTTLTNIIQNATSNPMITFNFDGDIIIPPGYILTIVVNASAAINMNLVLSWWEL